MLLLLASVLLVPAGAIAQRNDGDAALRRRALDLVEEGQALYSAEQYEEAIAVLERAYIVYPDPTIQYNIARSLERLGRTEEAAERYARYLETAGANAPDRGQVEARIEALRSAPPAAPRSPPTEDGVQPEGSAPPRTRENAPSRDTASASPDRAAHTEPQREEGDGPSWLPWAIGGLGAAAIATGVVFGVMADEAHRDAADAESQRDAFERQQDAESLATVANVLFVAGAAVTAAAAVVIVIGAIDGDDETSAQSPTEVRLGFGTVSVGGRF